MNTLGDLTNRWNEFWFPESNGLNLAICRIIVVGACLLFFFPPLQTHLELLKYNDGFLNPPRVQQLMTTLFGEQVWRSPQLFTGVHWVTIATGLLAVVGLRTRIATAVFGLGFLILVTHRWSYGAAMEIGPIKPMDTANAIFFLGSSHKCVHDSAPSRSATPWKEAADVLVPANQR